MVATNGSIKAGSFTGPELEHYIVSNGGPNFTLGGADVASFFGIMNQSYFGGPADWPAGEIALIGEFKTTGHIVNGQKFALVAGSGWTAASLSTALSCTIMQKVY